MKIKGIILLFLGVCGAGFVGIFNIISGKPVNDIAGPKSILGFIVSGLFLLAGAPLLFKKTKTRN